MGYIGYRLWGRKRVEHNLMTKQQQWRDLLLGIGSCRLSPDSLLSSSWRPRKTRGVISVEFLRLESPEGWWCKSQFKVRKRHTPQFVRAGRKQKALMTPPSALLSYSGPQRPGDAHPHWGEHQIKYKFHLRIPSHKHWEIMFYAGTQWHRHIKLTISPRKI